MDCVRHKSCSTGNHDFTRHGWMFPGWFSPSQMVANLDDMICSHRSRILKKKMILLFQTHPEQKRSLSKKVRNNIEKRIPTFWYILMVSHISIFCLYVEGNWHWNQHAWVVTAPSSSKNTSQTCLVCTSPWLQAESMCTLLIVGSTLGTQRGGRFLTKNWIPGSQDSSNTSPAFPPLQTWHVSLPFVRSYPGKSSPLKLGCIMPYGSIW